MAQPRPLTASKQACLDYLDLFMDQVERERSIFAEENRRLACPITAVWVEIGQGSLFQIMSTELGKIREALAAYGPEYLPLAENPPDEASPVDRDAEEG